jgi:precorrin-2 dehydrogenase / sirohydrochlorin ferrochelatase
VSHDGARDGLRRVSGYPILLEGTRIEALVVGGGNVGWRKAAALLECGATVRVVAPTMCAPLRAAAASSRQLTLIERPYAAGDIADAILVIAATSDPMVNAQVAVDANAARRLVNVVDAPEDGHYVTVATARADPLIIGVSTGGVPRAAAQIRDAISGRFDARYQSALSRLAALRQRLLSRGDRDGWHAAESALIDDQFCAHIEAGTFSARLSAWDTGSKADPLDVAWP